MSKALNYDSDFIREWDAIYDKYDSSNKSFRGFLWKIDLFLAFFYLIVAVSSLMNELNIMTIVISFIIATSLFTHDWSCRLVALIVFIVYFFIAFC